LQGIAGSSTGLDASLSGCYKRHTGVDVSGTKKGDDIWRLRYHELDGAPLEQWPADASQYALDDPKITLEVYDGQCNTYGPPMEDMYRQAEADFFLCLMGVVGFATDPEAHAVLVKRVRENIAENLPPLLKAGLFVKDPKKEKAGDEFPYTRKKKVFEQLIIQASDKAEMEVPRKPPTAKMKADGKTEGNISCDSDAVGLLAPFCETLQVFQKISTDLHNQSTYLKPFGEPRVHASLNVLVETGRTSCRQPNLQNPPREAGYRECFVADPGHLLLAIDYSFIELVSLAYCTKVLLDLPEEELYLYNAINSGKDPHLVTALRILQAKGDCPYNTYEEIEKAYEDEAPEVLEARQMAKAPNFGYPGGMGVDAFVGYARTSYGIHVTVTDSEGLKAAWFDAQPEMKEYFKFIGKCDEGSGSISVRQVSTDRIRAGASFCSACNSYFQGLTADGAKRAICKTGHMCYGDPDYAGCSQKLFVHDEIIFQIPDYEDHDYRQKVVDGFELAMIQGMSEVMPGMKIGVESTLTKRWIKKAKPRFDSYGRLDVYEG